MHQAPSAPPLQFIRERLLHKLQDRIQFSETGVKVNFGETPAARVLLAVVVEHLMFDLPPQLYVSALLAILQRELPEVWTEGTATGAGRPAHSGGECKPSTSPIQIHYLPLILLEVKKEIREHINHLWETNILVPSQNPGNPPATHQKAEMGQYQPVQQDLWEINKKTNPVSLTPKPCFLCWVRKEPSWT